MFDWYLFVALIVICLPGLWVGTTRLIVSLQSIIAANIEPGRQMPSRSRLVLVGFLQNGVIVAVAAAVGVAVQPHTGLDAPVLMGVVNGRFRPQSTITMGLTTLFMTMAATFLFLLVYYRLLRPRLDGLTVASMEKLRQHMGVWSRLLYGGVVEEVIFRWGVMNLLIWGGTRWVGTSPATVVWVAAAATGVLFGLGHLPSHFAAGCQKTPLFVTAVIGLNLWLSLLFGGLFWQFGLEAAILGHMLFHLIWLPFELHTARLRLTS